MNRETYILNNREIYSVIGLTLCFGFILGWITFYMYEAVKLSEHLHSLNYIAK